MKPVLPCALVLFAIPLSAQSLLYRSPNLGGTWTPDGGVVQFNFAHRFYVSPAPSHTVVNYPSFTLAAGVARHIALGWHFGTHSLIPSVTPSVTSSNESELYARYRLGLPEGQDGFSVAVTPAYNALAKSLDGEVGVDWTSGPITLEGAARVMQKPLGGAGGARAAFGGGVVARLTEYVAVSADVGSFVGPTTLATWGAALSVVIPGSPHTFSLQSSSAAVNTIQGNSRGTSQRRYGFEFTIPLHLRRFSPWFHRPAALRTPQPLMNVAAAAEVVIEGLRFGTDTVTISAGQIVKWVNHEDFEHTVTFNAPDAAYLSGALSPKGELAIRFDRPGTYPYHCLPHPTMRGVVVVR
jgi:plastocyanin